LLGDWLDRGKKTGRRESHPESSTTTVKTGYKKKFTEKVALDNGKRRGEDGTIGKVVEQPQTGFRQNDC